jgi:hypothetical protein
MVADAASRGGRRPIDVQHMKPGKNFARVYETYLHDVCGRSLGLCRSSVSLTELFSLGLVVHFGHFSSLRAQRFSGLKDYLDRLVQSLGRSAQVALRDAICASLAAHVIQT